MQKQRHIRNGEFRRNRATNPATSAGDEDSFHAS
jgi:hypothetical protein